jgi:peptidoglycan/LPS O-acetylase OafA/YrhL
MGWHSSTENRAEILIFSNTGQNLKTFKTSHLKTLKIEPSMQKKFAYIPAFDGLRGVAVLFVILAHGSYGYVNGWIGVDIFFILSGYLITSILQEEYDIYGTISFRNFFARRLLRLLPALLIAIVIANILWPYTARDWPHGNQLLASLSSLFYFNNLLSDGVTASLSPLWSLSVEEHFYFFWPLLTTLFLFKINLKHRIQFVIILILTVSAFRVYAFLFANKLDFGLIIIDYYRFTLCRIDAIMTGAILAFLPSYKFDKLKSINPTIILIFLTCFYIYVLVFLEYDSRAINTGGFTIINIICAITVIFAIQNPTNFLLANGALKWIGRRSYGIYVYHEPIFSVLEHLRISNNNTNLLFVTILRLILPMVIAELSYRFIEKPILKYKDKFVSTNQSKNIEIANSTSS